MSTKKAKAKQNRLIVANSIIKIISSYGRRFFWNKKEMRVAQFEIHENGRLYFRDDYTDVALSATDMGSDRWKQKFSHGETMHSLIKTLGLFIRLNNPVNIKAHFGPWHEYLWNSDLWGYGYDMENVREEVTVLLEGV